MKVQIILLAVIVGILATGTAYAAKNEGDGDPQRNRFERLDADGNGRIDRDEFAQVGDFRFGKLDANGDGAITLAELEDRDRSDRLSCTSQGRSAQVSEVSIDRQADVVADQARPDTRCLLRGPGRHGPRRPFHHRHRASPGHLCHYRRHRIQTAS